MVGEPNSGGVAGVVPISELNEERRDLALLRRAANEGWDVPQADRPGIVKRLVGIVNRTTVTVGSMAGPIEVESVADSHAIAASRVLLGMTDHNQRDRHHAEGSKVHETRDVRILVVDGGGNERECKSLRDFYTRYPAAVPAPDPGPDRSIDAQGRDGGPTGGQDGGGSRRGG